MIFSPIAFTKVRDVTATVSNVSPNAANITGYNFWGFEIDNTSNAATAYVQIFNKPASQVTLGTTIADLIYAVNASTSRGFGFGPYVIFQNGLSIAVTTTKNGLTALGSGDDITIYYQEK